MESIPKYISGFPEIDQSTLDKQGEESTYVNCNICRNFSNILNPGHRKSKDHQKKMSDKLRTLRIKIKTLGQHYVSVHDEEWQKNQCWYCYFCDKSVTKHKISDGLMIETYGYISHLASSDHAKAVKSYLKYHSRNEQFETFCKTEEQLKKFMLKIPGAKEKYLKKMEILNMKDVQSIRETEEQRKKLVDETVQMCNEINSGVSDELSHSTNKQHTVSAVDDDPYKTAPWKTEESESKPQSKQSSNEPVIGPTMETFVEHVADQKKKRLPAKRLGANIKHTKEFSSRWLPSFKGVWNKRKRKFPTKSRKFHQKS